MEFRSYIPPVPRSLSDAEVQAALGQLRSDYEGTLEAMAFLEEQAKLRTQDNEDFSTWVSKMQENGTPQALWALENAMRQRSGLKPLPEPDFQNISSALPETSEVTLGAAATAPAVPAPVAEPIPAPVPAPLFSPITDLTEKAVSPAAITEAVSEAPILAEKISTESEPKLNRRSQASSQFWAWLGLSGSILPLGLGAVVGQFDVSFMQGVVAIVLAALASASIISIGSLAGKRSGLGTVFLSRAAFGVGANVAPAAILVLARFFWSAVLLWSVLALHRPLINSQITVGGLEVSAFITPIVVLCSSAVLAYLGGRFLFRAQQVSGLLGVGAGLLLVTFVLPNIAWSELFSESNRSWLETFASATLVLSVFGLAWSGTGADFARKLSVDQLGLKVVASAFLALAFVPSLFGVFGLALARGLEKSTPGFSASFNSNFAGAISSVVQPWLAVVLGVSALISIAVILAMSLYSTNLGLHGIGLRIQPKIAQPILALVVSGVVIAAANVYEVDFTWQTVSDYSVFFAVPVAAWSGIFVSDVLIRRIAYHEISLSRTYGFYKSINVVNLAGWLVATTFGFGLIDSNAIGIQWLGFLAPYLANPGYWLSTNFGILVALAVGILVPLATGIPRIRRQEAEVLAIEARRTELRDVLGIVD